VACIRVNVIAIRCWRQKRTAKKPSAIFQTVSLGTSVNKGKKTVPQARELVEAQGCELLFLPPYSLDLNPIEEAFSKMKSLLRRMMGRAICAVRTRDALGFFEYCCYRIASQPQ
jgi:hypothetical protein